MLTFVPSCRFTPRSCTHHECYHSGLAGVEFDLKNAYPNRAMTAPGTLPASDCKSKIMLLLANARASVESLLFAFNAPFLGQSRMRRKELTC